MSLTGFAEPNSQTDCISQEASPDSENSISEIDRSIECPKCKSQKLWRDGLRYTIFGDEIQRWRCRDCGLRFSDPNDIQKSWSKFENITRIREQSLKTGNDIVTSRQICVTETKNLGPEQTSTQSVPERREDVNGKLVQFAWKMK